MSELILTKDNFETEVLNSELPVIVDFWADWCGPCKKLSPIISQIAAENKGKLKVGKVNVDEQMALASKYKIMTIPTVILFQNGRADKTAVGFKSKTDLLRFFEI
ncbi:MAG: thioredoxin [Lachnospiraceae bacterium]|nr:thioredoxin [Lachnospiraceae bacterium]